MEYELEFFAIKCSGSIGYLYLCVHFTVTGSDRFYMEPVIHLLKIKLLYMNLVRRNCTDYGDFLKTLLCVYEMVM